jgi:23S rRNA pseudouridine2604 synthase
MTRINKWLSEMGVCSRKQADRLIQNKEVLVNNQPATLGMLIDSNDIVTVSGKLIQQKPKAIYLLYHKPVGVVCTHDLGVKNNIEQAINYPQRIFAVGRLDKESEGLMLLTNQGDSVNKIMRAENHHEKVYQVWVDKPITENFVQKMASGVPILHTITLPCKVRKIGEQCFEITLTQGLNLQIRRMAKELGYRVVRLKRIQIMEFTLSGLEVGDIRLLSDKEITDLKEELEKSRNAIEE